MDLLKNIPTDAPMNMTEAIHSKPGQVISMALSKSDHTQMTLLAFGKDEGVSEETYFGDTLYYVLEGTMKLSEGEKEVLLNAGECIAIPAKALHAIYGVTDFKILQITLS
ncbi:MAG TPA: cupin domain-containing protein [Candidatus Dorea intestinavium]|nr:cupin domain-containing protein [Candidatus Dorea intestinavium]